MRIGLCDGDVLHHAALWGAETLEDYKANLENSFHELRDEAVLGHVRVFMNSRKGNFRSELYPDYKKTASREKSRAERGELSRSALDYIYSLPGVLEAPTGLEADDCLAIEASRLDPEERIIITVDKDLLQIPGRHYNPHYMVRRHFTVTREEALRNLNIQLLRGDPVDRIQGLPRIGPVKAEALLNANPDPRIHYRAFYGSEWEEHFVLQGQLLYLLRHWNDKFSIDRYENLFSNREDHWFWSLDTSAPGSASQDDSGICLPDCRPGNEREVYWEEDDGGPWPDQSRNGDQLAKLHQ